jgi:uncharacterized protein
MNHLATQNPTNALFDILDVFGETILLYRPAQIGMVIQPPDILDDLRHIGNTVTPADLAAHESALRDILPQLPARPAAPPPQHLELIVHPNSSCNMACTYCMNAQGTQDGKVETIPMTWETAKAIVSFVRDWLDRHDKTQHPTTVHVLFTGGEPTTNAPTLEVLIRDLVALNNAHQPPRVFMSLATNGLRIPKPLWKTIHNHKDVIRLYISIDGNEQRHDATRKNKGGRGTFAQAEHAAKIAAYNGIPYEISAITPPPYDFISVAKELQSIGQNRFRVHAMHTTAAAAAIWGADIRAQSDASIQDAQKAYAAYLVRQGDRVHTDLHQLAAQLAIPDWSERTVLAIRSDGAVFECDRHFAEDDRMIANAVSSLSDLPLDQLRHAGPRRYTCQHNSSAFSHSFRCGLALWAHSRGLPLPNLSHAETMWNDGIP